MSFFVTAAGIGALWWFIDKSFIGPLKKEHPDKAWVQYVEIAAMIVLFVLIYNFW
ncbi:MAG: hypothetical protein RR091_10815 [Cloacibacillus sp.]